MMLKTALFLCICTVFALPGNAQFNRYIIELTDKANNNYSLSTPSEFLTARSLLRRNRYFIAIDSTDLPVTSRYLDSIRSAGAVTIINTSKWLNQVAILTTDADALTKINSFPFVKATKAIAARFLESDLTLNKFQTIPVVEASQNFAPTIYPESLNQYYNYGMSNGQVKIHKGDFLHNHGFRGEGMQMAILDAGFSNYLGIPTFDSIRNNNQILGTWDYVTNNTNVNAYLTHGTHCLSTIAANMPGVFIGTAPKTSFYLYRTEDAVTEYPIEEQNLAAALEKADSLGVDLASISLGYSTFTNTSFNYTYNNLDGNTTISARAADKAAQKGMLIVVANGNEGDKSWHYLITPADADSVLAVGAVDTLGNIAAFSSYGPSSDGQIKPGVAAVGLNAVVANANTGQPAYSSGTSFACPNMAGLATCLWQAFPEINNMGIISSLQESASKANTPDNRVGYGIPDLKKAFVILIKRLYTQNIRQAGCNTLINWTAKNSLVMNFEIQRKLPADADYISIHSQSGSGNFANGNFSYSDDLSTFGTPVNISYRIKMNIDNDSSFYFTPISINHINACNTYSFNGNGNWTDTANWAAGQIPPSPLPAGSTILINPIEGGECILNASQNIASGALFNVLSGKKLLIPGNLNLQQ